MIKIGNLEFVKATAQLQLLAAVVAEAIKNLNEPDQIGVAEIDPTLSDTQAFCEKYDVSLEQAANCVILETKGGGERGLAACVILATTRADVNGVVKKTLGRKASFAKTEQAVQLSQMEYGAITPLGLPTDWPILVDGRVAEADYVIIGSGLRISKICFPGSIFKQLPKVQIVSDLAN